VHAGPSISRARGCQGVSAGLDRLQQRRDLRPQRHDALSVRLYGLDGHLQLHGHDSCFAFGPECQTPDTLADVAQYYWKTDLRDPALTPDRCTGGPVVTGEVTVHNNVCTNDALKGPRQNMITYTLGLGASGLMGYDKDYPTATSGDFYSIKLPENANPDAGICPWQPVGTPCNWPKPESNAQTNIDDLWHAAVNGRGTYFSASDPSSLAGGISSALQSVEVKAGALAAVTVTSPNLVADEAGNSIFEVSFTAGDWSGDLVKRTIDGTTGAISATPTWAAQAKLDAKVSTGTGMRRARSSPSIPARPRPPN
jgi:type IV pilus assembly protein PilY1